MARHESSAFVRLAPHFILGAVVLAATVWGVAHAEELAQIDAPAQPPSGHTDLVLANQELYAPDVGPNKLQDFVRLDSAVVHALTDIDKLIASYSQVSGPDDAPLKTLLAYKAQFAEAHMQLTQATPYIADVQSHFSPYHTTTSALRVAQKIKIPDPVLFDATYTKLVQFYDNLSPGEFVRADGTHVSKDWISSHVPFKDVAPAPQDPIAYFAHVPDKPALIPPRLAYQIDRMVHALPPELQGLKVTAGNAEIAADQVHLQNSCHYRAPLTCVDMNFISPNADAQTIGKTLALMNQFSGINHVNYEMKDYASFVKMHAEVKEHFGDAVAQFVTHNRKSTGDHLHAAFE